MARICVWPPGFSGDGVSEARLLQPARVLIAQGADVVIDRSVPCLWDRRFEGDRAPLTANVIGLSRKVEADVVVIARPARKHWAQVIPFLQAQGIRVVVDMDDDLTAIPPEHPAFKEYEPLFSAHHNWKWAQEACRLADLVTVSTPALLKMFGFGHGTVLPNAVPASYLMIEPEERRDTVGWSGRVDTHVGDLEVTQGAVQRALAGSGWGFHVVGTGRGVREALGLDEEPTTTDGWVSYEGYPRKLAELGVGIVPIADSAFGRAKSALKLMELSSLGVPTVASPTPDNRRLHEFVGVGLLADTPRRWHRHLSSLIRNPEKRADLAGRSREAMASQTYERRAEEWLNAWDPSSVHKATSGRVRRMAPKVFLGIITCERPSYLSIVLDGYRDHLAQLVDYLLIVHDGIPSLPTGEACGEFYLTLSQTGGERKGVAVAKNMALRYALDHTDAEWIFLLEDDIVPQSPRAITGYIEAAQASGIEHLQFHAHGEMNKTPVATEGPVTYWPHYIGGYTLFSRASLEVGGLLDEAFVNAWDHCEHTLRLAENGFCPLPDRPGAHRVADATGSEAWLREIPGSIERSVIKRLWPDLPDLQLAGKNYWRETYPSTYKLVFQDPPNG